ncbi:MAG: hypothetical protein ACYTXY_18825 [Nostoc sp.]
MQSSLPLSDRVINLALALPKAEAIENVKQHFLVCGYEEWLKEAE